MGIADMARTATIQATPIVISAHPIPSHPIPFHPIPSHPIPSHPITNKVYHKKARQPCTSTNQFPWNIPPDSRTGAEMEEPFTLAQISATDL